MEWPGFQRSRAELIEDPQEAWAALLVLRRECHSNVFGKSRTRSSRRRSNTAESASWDHRRRRGAPRCRRIITTVQWRDARLKPAGLPNHERLPGYGLLHQARNEYAHSHCERPPHEPASQPV